MIADIPTIETPYGSEVDKRLRGRETLYAAFCETRQQLDARHGAVGLEPWAAGVLDLVNANAGPACMLAFWRASRELALHLSPAQLGEVARHSSAICLEANGQAAAAVIAAFVRIAPRLCDADGDRYYWQAFHRLAAVSPESVPALAERVHLVFLQGRGPDFQAFVETGLKAAGKDRQRRHAFFTLADPLASRFIARIGSGPGLSELESELRAMLTALWGRVPDIQPLSVIGRDASLRASIAGPVLRLPEVFPGLGADAARRLYLASAAHASAHLAFGNPRFAVGKFRPVQIAFVTLVEDARIEALAVRRYPGLRHLWAPFHTADADSGPILDALLARVARGLFDPSYRDPDMLVERAQGLFAAVSDKMEDPAISLDIGTRLADDIRQRRIRYNARGHVVEPPYRDDGLGLWDFSDIESSAVSEVELTVEAARMERREADDGKTDRETSPEAAGRARPAEMQTGGVEIATYPEWDPEAGFERPDWTTVKAMPPASGDTRGLQNALRAAGPVRRRIAQLVKAARIGRPTRLTRQTEGEDLDIDAAIDTAIDFQMGEMPDTRIYRSTALQRRDLAVLVLIDISQSTAARLAGGDSILDVEKCAVAMLGETLFRLGDRFALLAFASAGRGEVQFHEIKSFAASYDGDAQARLAGLSSGLSTRLGAALRHAGAQIEHVSSFRKLILVLTDGAPFDIDTPVETLEQDARRAVVQLRARGIDTYGVTLDPTQAGCGPRLFGKTNCMPVHRLEDLPLRLSELYFRLARR